MEDFRRLLKQYWGYEDFRPLQLDIIESVCSGRDTIALLPTGAGKSITYQIPALAMSDKGLTLVVTPLIALMEDQVNALKSVGIRAVGIHSGYTHSQILYRLEQAECGAYDIMYVSPERLSSSLFLKRVQFLKISLIAVDEAHCISQWGYDFRPQYLKIAEIRTFVPDIPILALTASATPEVVDDIGVKLAMSDPKILIGSFSRPNLNYVVRHVDNKVNALPEILYKVGGCAIVYVRQRVSCKEWSDIINAAGISSTYYHAGLTAEQKKANQDKWMSGQSRVMVATSAFGMGIDKSDVRLVIHVDLPDSMEAYYQEAGRAGRDGKTAYPIMLVDKGDVTRLKKRSSTSFPSKDYISKVYQSLADFYVIGAGSGEGDVYPFDIVEFSSKCSLNQAMALSAIKILEMSGYLTLTDEIENPSKFRFIVSRNDLYDVRFANPLNEKVLVAIMRIYSGVFVQSVHISEDRLARELNVPRNVIYDSLIFMSRMNIIEYIPFRKTPLLIYDRERVDVNELYIPKSAYEYRMERMLKRQFAIIEYVNQESVCRERYIINYFGQMSDNCGHCDVCRNNRRKGLTFQNIDVCDEVEYSREYISRLIKDILAESPIIVTMLLHELLRRMDVFGKPLMYEKYKQMALEQIRALLDDDDIRIVEGRYCLN